MCVCVFSINNSTPIPIMLVYIYYRKGRILPNFQNDFDLQGTSVGDKERTFQWNKFQVRFFYFLFFFILKKRTHLMILLSNAYQSINRSIYPSIRLLIYISIYLYVYILLLFRSCLIIFIHIRRK